MKTTKEIQAQYKEETGKDWMIVPVGHGDTIYASWDYQIWLENKFAEQFKSVSKVISLTVKEIKNAIYQFKEEKLPDAESPFHYDAEIWSGMKHFIKWLETKK